MGFESSPQGEVEGKDITSYFQEIKRTLIEKTLEAIELAPAGRKADVLNDALDFFGALSILDGEEADSIDEESLQKQLDGLAERAGLYKGIVSVSEYRDLSNKKAS